MNAIHNKTILREMREMVRMDPGSESGKLSLFQAGLRSFANEDFETALEAFRESIQLNPNFWFSNYYLGRCLRRLGLYEEAATYLQRAIELNPVHAPSHAYLGDIFLREGKSVEAEESFRRAIELQFDNLIALSGLAKLAQGNNGANDDIAELLRNAYFDGSKNPLLLMELFSIKKPDSASCLQIAEELSANGSYHRALFFYRLSLRSDVRDTDVHAKMERTRKALATEQNPNNYRS